ncbi:hypothetical protein QBC45DRAFT_397732 [Copromyces sp. CBS 386.78]|nr:hypothetical protein QBC45DRAFT_397732 [Copromyces sp. CBS 386.78]
MAAGCFCGQPLLHACNGPDQHRVQYSFQGMLQNLLLQLVRRFPADVSQCFSEAYTASGCDGARGDADEEAWASVLLRDTLKKALKEVQKSGPVYIFLDGVSGFDKECHAFIKSLAGVEGVKVCVSARPEGEFYGWHQSKSLYLPPGKTLVGVLKVPTLSMERFTHDDIQAFCEGKLGRLPLLSIDRTRITARIRENWENSFLAAEDLCEKEVDYIFGRPAASASPMRRSKALFNTMLTQYKDRNAGGSVAHMEKLSFLLNIIHLHETRGFASARNGRPLSLLELALCEVLALWQDPVGAALDDLSIDLNDLCQQKLSTLAQRIKDCYPFILMRALPDNDDFQPGVSTAELSKQAASIQVTVLHKDLHRILAYTEEGKNLLRIDDEVRHSQSNDTGTSQTSSDRLKWMVTASLWEHVLVMPKLMEEGAHPDRQPRRQQRQVEPEWEEYGEKAQHWHAFKISLLKLFRRTPPRAATSPTDGEIPEQPELGYHPYREHLALAQKQLSAAAPAGGSINEEEMFPKAWVAKYSPNPILEAAAEDAELEGETDVEGGGEGLFWVVPRAGGTSDS